MSKLKIGMLVVATVAMVSAVASRPVLAADLGLPTKAQPAEAANCGPCGCLHVSYEYHREMEKTYGLDYDPRNYDQTQPHYYLGAVRAYPRYWCDYGPNGPLN
jgi:hypothetical protein